jgi:hypothetical protein
MARISSREANEAVVVMGMIETPGAIVGSDEILGHENHSQVPGSCRREVRRPSSVRSRETRYSGNDNQPSAKSPEHGQVDPQPLAIAAPARIGRHLAQPRKGSHGDRSLHAWFELV